MRQYEKKKKDKYSPIFLFFCCLCLALIYEQTNNQGLPIFNSLSLQIQTIKQHLKNATLEKQ